MKFRFRPFLAAWTALAVLAAGFLASWQFDRAAQKRALEEAARAESRAAAVFLTAESPPPRRFQRAMLAGRFLPEGNVLIDNRIRGRRPGYDAVAPFLLDDGKIAAVNRGWIPARLDRTPPAVLPPSAARTTIRGVFVSDQSDALELKKNAAEEGGKILQNLKLSDYAARFNFSLRTTLVFALADSAAGLLPPTVAADFRSSRSEAYAWQWMTFGFLALLFFVLLSRDGGPGGKKSGQGGRIRNVPLFLILLIGAGAPVFSTALFFLWRPDSFTHYGELISPPAKIPAEWRGADGGPAEWNGRWILIRAGGSACGLECRRELCRMRQLRLMMHGDYPRVARAWLLTDGGAAPDSLTMTTDCGEVRAADLRERAAEADILSGVKLLRSESEGGLILPAGWLHVADPNGRLVMRYPPDANLYKIRRDFRRLLKLSKRRKFTAEPGD